MKRAPRLWVLLGWLAALAPTAAAESGIAHASSVRAHLDLEVELDPASRRLHARAQFSASGAFVFTLHRSLAVLTATAGARPLEVTLVGESGEVRRWRVTASHGETLQLEYGGTLPPLDPTLDHRSVLHVRAPMAARAGSFLSSGSGWYPQPAARFSYRLKLSLPGEQRGLVPGRLTAETLPGDKNARYEAVFHFEPPADGIDLMAGPYSVRERFVPRADAPPLRLRTYFFSDMEALAEDYLADSARYIALYSELIGAYPFSEFSVVASPLPTGLGMPSLTYIGARVLRLPFIRVTSLGHEVLHNWWGNGVYVDYASGNWSEGLTTFMADYFYRERQSAAAAKAMRLSWLRDFAAVPEGSHQPLSAFRSRAHGVESALGYGKAAMLFVMLRDEIGEEAFSRGIRRFWARHRFKVASWRDLQIAFEESSGQPLHAFFEQWVRRAGGPRLEIAAARARNANGKPTLAITLQQSTPPYSLRAPVQWVAEDRTGMQHVAIDREREVVTITADAVPRGMRLDPEFRLWRRLEPEAVPPILRQWIVARAPRLAIVSGSEAARRAAQTLARRFFEASPETVSDTGAARNGEPVLIIGLDGDVERTLSSWRLPPPPGVVANRGSARVWTIQRSGSAAPIAVVSARDADALAALAKPLPHYGGQSYLAFEGSRAIARGVWPAHVRLTPVSR
ncbi:MAG TPA: M1 family aminopeptidase [Burkholderiales bacterium]|nr:M1 family aminopeptidase [Burkholderiales bacterium]